MLALECQRMLKFFFIRKTIDVMRNKQREKMEFLVIA